MSRLRRFYRSSIQSCLHALFRFVYALSSKPVLVLIHIIFAYPAREIESDTENMNLRYMAI